MWQTHAAGWSELNDPLYAEWWHGAFGRHGSGMPIAACRRARRVAQLA